MPGFVLTDELREALGDVNVGGDDVRPGLFQYFHTDDSYVECPAHVTVLHARALPSGGGGATSFIDMRVAYDLLDDGDSGEAHRSQGRARVQQPRCVCTPSIGKRRPGVAGRRSRIPSCVRIP